MSLAVVLGNFNASAAQCGALVANAHQLDGAGVPLLPQLDQSQITAAAFLNLFVGWETFLEESLAELLTGSPTLSGKFPVRYVLPTSADHARRIVIGTQRYFDYGNHDHFRKLVGELLQYGYPFEPHLSALVSDLQDLRTMRNASAHISSSTQSALESLATRMFGAPHPGITLYRMLLLQHPKSSVSNTVFGHAADTLQAAAQLIAQG